MITIKENIFYDDQLINLIKSNFNQSDIQLFELQKLIFKEY